MSVTKDNLPLVSIGMPVRNGCQTIALALECMLCQTYQNIEIIISDNNSTDGTTLICSDYLSKYASISYYKHNKTLTATQNFNYVLKKARGEFFAWAAHDDLRSTNWVDILARCLIAHPNSCMASSDYAVIHSPKPSTLLIDKCYPRFFGKKKVSIFESFNSSVHCIHTYGLFRTQLLSLYSFRDIDYSGDHALVAFMSFIGTFTYCKGAYFYYYCPLSSKTANQHAMEVGGKSLIPFARLRLSWFTSLVLSDAVTINGGRRRAITFLPAAIWIFHKSLIYGMMPRYITRIWKHLKAA